jgi:hypothetical protein
MDMACVDLDEEEMTEPDNVFDTGSTMTTTTRDVATSFKFDSHKVTIATRLSCSMEERNGASFEGGSLRAAPTNA